MSPVPRAHEDESKTCNWLDIATIIYLGFVTVVCVFQLSYIRSEFVQEIATLNERMEQCRKQAEQYREQAFYAENAATVCRQEIAQFPVTHLKLENANKELARCTAKLNERDRLERECAEAIADRNEFIAELLDGKELPK